MNATSEVDPVWQRLMPPAPADLNTESDRLATLRAYNILDTSAEAAYDRVVELARDLFDVPIAAVAFMDETRLWFKSRIGFGATEAPREVVFCDHAIRHDSVMVVPDLRADPRFTSNPLVLQDPQLRFYAGAPLAASNGQRLGTVCIMSPDPRRDFSEEDRSRLAALAGIVSDELELRLQAARAQRLAGERGLLLEAIEHRLRGSLQLVTSVLQTQATRSGEGRVRRALYEAADRVGMIEAVHQQLFQSSDVFETDAREYLLALIGNLQDAADDKGSQRVLVLNIANNLGLNPDRLAAVGLVVTELLTGTLHHGHGQIDLSITLDGEVIVITLNDEGAGFQFDLAPDKAAHRPDLRLVTLLALPDGVSVDPERQQRITVRMRQ